MWWRCVASDVSTRDLTDECVETHEYACVCTCKLDIFKKIYMGMKKAHLVVPSYTMVTWKNKELAWRRGGRGGLVQRHEGRQRPPLRPGGGLGEGRGGAAGLAPTREPRGPGSTAGLPQPAGAASPSRRACPRPPSRHWRHFSIICTIKKEHRYLRKYYDKKEHSYLYKH